MKKYRKETKLVRKFIKENKLKNIEFGIIMNEEQEKIFQQDLIKIKERMNKLSEEYSEIETELNNKIE